MNKIAVTFALVAAFVGLVAANKHDHHHIPGHIPGHNPDGEWIIGVPNDDHIRFNIELVSDRILMAEVERRGYHHCRKVIGHGEYPIIGVGPGSRPYVPRPHNKNEGHGGFYHDTDGGYHTSPHSYDGPGRKNHRKRGGNTFGRPKGHLPHHPIALVGGAELSKTKLGSIGAGTHLGSHKSIKGDKESHSGNNKFFDVSHNDASHSEQEGIRKHQVFNNDKTFIRDQSNGVNDVDGFRNTHGHSDNKRLTAGSSQNSGESSSGRIEVDRDLDTDFEASGAVNTEVGIDGGLIV